MDIELIRTAGQVAGIAGLIIATFLIIFRAVIKRGSFNVLLTKRQVFELIRLTLFLTWSFALLALFGLGLWAYATKIEERRQSGYAPVTPTPVTPPSGAVPPGTPTPVTTTPVTTTSITPTPGTPTPGTPIPGTPTLHSVALPVTLSVSGYKKTSICVVQGDRLEINASGTISFGPSIRHAGPNGKNTFKGPFGIELPIDTKYYKEENIPFGSLLCKLDTSRQWQRCGMQKEFVAAAAGCVEFDVNDNMQDDNSGDFSVTVSAAR